MICASLRQKQVTFKQTFFGDRSLLLLVRVTLSIRRLSALFVYMVLIIRIYGVGLTDVVIYIRSLALTTYRGYIYVYTRVHIWGLLEPRSEHCLLFLSVAISLT